MGSTIERTFAAREKAELAVEHLVQEHGFERTDIFVAAEGDDNSAGEIADAGAAENGPITVSIDLDDDAKAALVEAVFDEIQAD
jgi:hypothetical protein